MRKGAIPAGEARLHQLRYGRGELSGGYFDSKVFGRLTEGLPAGEMHDGGEGVRNG